MSKSKQMKFENVDYYKDISLNIAYYRRLRGYTQAALAEKVDISASYLASLESLNSTRRCSLEILFDLARALDIEPYQLLKSKDD